MGRTSILMVMGFNVIFALMGFSLSRVTEEAVKNYSLYYTNAAVHNMAASAANIAANQIFFTPNWREGYSNVPFAGGTYSVQVKDLPNRRIQITARATTQGPDETTGEYENKTATIIIVMQPSSFSKFAYYSVVEGGIYWITGDTVWGAVSHTIKTISFRQPCLLWQGDGEERTVQEPVLLQAEILRGVSKRSVHQPPERYVSA